jgi:hypothetical protein
MRNSTRNPPRHPSTAQPRDPLGSGTRSIRHASITAGVGMLLMSVPAGFGNFVALKGLVATGDAAQTAANIMDSEGRRSAVRTRNPAATDSVGRRP